MEGGFSDQQFGFHKARTTVNAVNMETGLTQDEIEQGKCCAVVIVGVKDAFNLCKIKTIVEGVVNLQAAYFVCIVVKFLLERKLYCDSDDGLKIFPAVCGVLQGLVYSPFLWLIMYDRVLTLCPRTSVATNTIITKCLDEVEIEINANGEINSC